jgi:spore coat-associated protein N
MSRHVDPMAVRSRRSRRTAGAAAFMLLGLAVTGAGVYAALNATAFNTSAQTVSSGTLKLTMAANGAGFSSSITNMAPGDVVNRYVDLTTNAGSIAAQNLTFAASDATPTKLSTDPSNGLHVTITSCSTAWVAATGLCPLGTTSVLLNNVSVSTLSSAAQTIVAGTPASTYSLQVSITLPDQSETTTNGTLPVGTIQGLSASMTWTFGESQRNPTTSNS